MTHNGIALLAVSPVSYFRALSTPNMASKPPYSLQPVHTPIPTAADLEKMTPDQLYDVSQIDRPHWDTVYDWVLTHVDAEASRNRVFASFKPAEQKVERFPFSHTKTVDEETSDSADCKVIYAHWVHTKRAQMYLVGESASISDLDLLLFVLENYVPRERGFERLTLIHASSAKPLSRLVLYAALSYVSDIEVVANLGTEVEFWDVKVERLEFDRYKKGVVYLPPSIETLICAKKEVTFPNFRSCRRLTRFRAYPTPDHVNFVATSKVRFANLVVYIPNREYNEFADENYPFVVVTNPCLVDLAIEAPIQLDTTAVELGELTLVNLLGAKIGHVDKLVAKVMDAECESFVINATVPVENYSLLYDPRFGAPAPPTLVQPRA